LVDSDSEHFFFKPNQFIEAEALRAVWLGRLFKRLERGWKWRGGHLAGRVVRTIGRLCLPGLRGVRK
jgi:hypothetical protein